jgi:ABC-2 type transport system ATP-binding protein
VNQIKTPPLQLSKLSGGYAKQVIFSDLSLDVQAGEIFGLIGLNGVGKTTLIKAILDLGRAEGEILIFGKNHCLPESRQQLAYLPEKFLPSPQLKGWEFLDLTLAYYGRKVDRTKAHELAIGLDLLPDALESPTKTYSKGMGQKLGLLATLLTELPLLILDEPMSGLDPRSRSMLKDRLVEYRQAGRTIFFSSHILADIEEICDRVGIMHGGRLIYLGTPAELISRWQANGLERAFLAAINNAEHP